MKKFLITACFSLYVIMGSTQTQTITLTFTGEDARTHNTLALQGVFIRNITRGCDTAISGGTSSVTLVNSLGIRETGFGDPESFSLLPNFINPFNGSTNVCIELTGTAKLHLSVANMQGKKVADYINLLSAGLHKFEITSAGSGIFILNVSDGKTSKSVKLISNHATSSANGIRYIGTGDPNPGNGFKSMASDGFVFHMGDSLQLIAAAEGYFADTLYAVPDQAASYTFQMNSWLVDGYYIKGDATACPYLNLNTRMKITRNEVTQNDRASLLELYIPVKAGSSGFNIVRVAGSVTTTYGPGSGFGVVTNGTQDEPKVPFQRGPCAENTIPFTVPVDGMYHVVIDYVLGKVVICPVHWGMIGASTPQGWSNDTMMTESAFNLADMTWNLSGLTLNNGDWKFRFSHGWKIELDTTIDLGGGMIGVKVNTNLGGSLDAFVPGGSNFINNNPGLYTCQMIYSLGTGYSATLIRTGNIPLIDYSQYEMGIIGDCYLKSDGVTQAFWDENFGTQLPVVTGGTIYTWTYAIPINVVGAFRFRQGDDWAGKSIGYGDVTIEGTAAGDFSSDGGNFKISSTGNYTLVLQIDAATEIYTVTATKN